MLRATLIVVALALTGCSTASALTAPTDPGLKGTQYVVNDVNPGVIAYEGTYAKSVAWTESHQGAWTTYRLPKGTKPCNPVKKVCLVP